MKLERQGIDSITLKEEQTQESLGEDAPFWDSIRSLVRYGVPAYDKRGHWTEIRIRVRPMQVDMIAAVREKVPENWFKTQASLYRSIVAVGCRTLLKFLDMDKGEWNDVLMGLNQIAKLNRLEDFKQEMAGLKNDLANGPIPAQERVNLIELVSKLEQKLRNM